MLKLLKHKIERSGDKVSLTGQWRTEMKTPAAVRLNFERGSLVDDGNDVIAIGDITDITGVLNGFAEMAWELGWRPRGLMGRMAHLIESYKLPLDTTK